MFIDGELAFGPSDQTVAQSSADMTGESEEDSAKELAVVKLKKTASKKRTKGKVRC